MLDELSVGVTTGDCVDGSRWNSRVTSEADNPRDTRTCPETPGRVPRHQDVSRDTRTCPGTPGTSRGVEMCDRVKTVNNNGNVYYYGQVTLYIEVWFAARQRRLDVSAATVTCRWSRFRLRPTHCAM